MLTIESISNPELNLSNWEKEGEIRDESRSNILKIYDNFFISKQELIQIYEEGKESTNYMIEMEKKLINLSNEMKILRRNECGRKKDNWKDYIHKRNHQYQ